MVRKLLHACVFQLGWPVVRGVLKGSVQRDGCKVYHRYIYRLFWTTLSLHILDTQWEDLGKFVGLPPGNNVILISLEAVESPAQRLRSHRLSCCQALPMVLLPIIYRLPVSTTMLSTRILAKVCTFQRVLPYSLSPALCRPLTTCMPQRMHISGEHSLLQQACLLRDAHDHIEILDGLPRRSLDQVVNDCRGMLRLSYIAVTASRTLGHQRAGGADKQKTSQVGGSILVRKARVTGPSPMVTLSA